MNLDSITPLIIEYRYWILIPLSMLEGPIVAFLAGTLASLGYFNVFALAIFFFARDMIMDSFYYAVGYFGGRTALAQRLLKKIGVSRDHLEDIRTLWEKHAGKTMFFGKLSYGIASSFVVLAGTVHMPLKKFFGWGAIVAIAQFWTLLALGYFFGSALSGTTKVIEITQYVIAGVTVVGSIYYLLSRRARKGLLDESAKK